MIGIETLFERIQRAGSDVSKDNPNRRKHHYAETFFVLAARSVNFNWIQKCRAGKFWIANGHLKTLKVMLHGNMLLLIDAYFAVLFPGENGFFTYYLEE